MHATVLGPLTPRSLEELVGKLPARLRAELAWAPTAMKRELRPLFESQVLTSQTIAEVTAGVFGIVSSVGALLDILSAADHSEIWTAFEAAVQKYARVLGQGLPEEVRPAASRALSTACVTSGVGLALLAREPVAGQLGMAFREIPKLGGHESMAGLRGYVLLIALVDAVERNLAPSERVSELARRADSESLAFARDLAAIDSGNPSLRLPWYFEPRVDAERFESIALWQSERAERNKRAVDLLEQWAAAPDAEQRDTWNFLKKALDQDRISGRKLFPESP